MQTWEYYSELIALIDGPKIGEVLTKLGQGGWELVNTVPFQSETPTDMGTYYAWFFFKRPL